MNASTTPAKSAPRMRSAGGAGTASAAFSDRTSRRQTRFAREAGLRVPPRRATRAHSSSSLAPSARECVHAWSRRWCSTSFSGSARTRESSSRRGFDQEETPETRRTWQCYALASSRPSQPSNTTRPRRWRTKTGFARRAVTSRSLPKSLATICPKRRRSRRSRREGSPGPRRARMTLSAQSALAASRTARTAECCRASTCSTPRASTSGLA
mmetsp:Transcript_42437/g.100909  ORF Transcript_42437/g.100909 Transcript_42437/m.100909 type:complete len:212 (-) Transcript_42437:352-987(-)